jgi:hypothetical protein
VEPDTSRLISNRRKNESLKNELNQLRSLLDCIRNRSEVESMEIYRRVRAAVDPMDVVEQLRGSESLASRLSDLELSALEHSSIKVHAEPWTRVAGDGLVSELITSFFAHDNGFYLAFIDQKCFLDDMQAGDVGNSEFCSSLLVNAICALRCVCHSVVICTLVCSHIDAVDSQLPNEPECMARSKASIYASDSWTKPGSFWTTTMADDA